MFNQKSKEFVIGGGVELKDMPYFSIGGGKVADYIKRIKADDLTREEILFGHYSYAVLNAMNYIRIKDAGKEVPLDSIKDERLKQMYMDTIIQSINLEVMSWIKKDKNGLQIIDIPEKMAYGKAFGGYYADMIEMTLLEAGYTLRNGVVNKHDFMPFRYKGEYRLDSRIPKSTKEIQDGLDNKIMDNTLIL